MRIEGLEHGHNGLADDSVGIYVLNVEILDNGLCGTEFLVGGERLGLELTPSDGRQREAQQCDV